MPPIKQLTCHHSSNQYATLIKYLGFQQMSTWHVTNQVFNILQLRIWHDTSHVYGMPTIKHFACHQPRILQYSQRNAVVKTTYPSKNSLYSYTLILQSCNLAKFGIQSSWNFLLPSSPLSSSLYIHISHAIYPAKDGQEG